MRSLLTGVFLLLFSFCCLAQSITNAEYFFNTDPGVGSGTTLIVNSNTGQLTQTFSIPTMSLADGFHSLYLRTYNNDNNWSLYDRQNFYLKRFPSSNIIMAEYFFNTDPGIGNGTSLSVNGNTGTLNQAFTIPTAGLSEGFNNLYIRTFSSENNWSLYDRQSFYLKSFDAFTISEVEYFFNTDPGVGNGTPIAVDNNTGQLTQVFSFPTTGLSEGFHSFYLRTKDNADNWSLYDRQIIYIKDLDLSPDEVSSAEYFIDSDPGIGNGTSIVFGDASLSSQILNINSTGLIDGDHLFYVRVQDTNGDWSIYDTALFTIDSSLGINNSLLSKVSLLPNPFENNLIIKLPNNIHINKIEIYNTLGQTVFSTTENKTALGLSNLKSGIYILNLETTLGNASFKILKK
ncbi:T9SS type A sorting domain-containing protein [Flavivirga jejuensis]|uniref:T9SS type A sorting domain-containing protein n=1 Tax=Flavivirga jejuensis TaxID=870487 RepID=A0ABT8WPA8_9FLAO|nr:T9SS type A sorting domain-containing protein [Flavivirga jejuensis]MDO5974814.1 T9SS type A sorting domain-containing protein [Flavivirga jejuensis]